MEARNPPWKYIIPEETLPGIAEELRILEKYRTIRLIKPYPVLAMKLASRRPLVIPEPIYYWLVGLMADAGYILRSRYFWIHFALGTAMRYLLYLATLS